MAGFRAKDAEDAKERFRWFLILTSAFCRAARGKLPPLVDSRDGNGLLDRLVRGPDRVRKSLGKPDLRGRPPHE